jgi:hypothetical protein
MIPIAARLSMGGERLEEFSSAGMRDPFRMKGTALASLPYYRNPCGM